MTTGFIFIFIFLLCNYYFMELKFSQQQKLALLTACTEDLTHTHCKSSCDYLHILRSHTFNMTRELITVVCNDGLKIDDWYFSALECCRLSSSDDAVFYILFMCFVDCYRQPLISIHFLCSRKINRHIYEASVLEHTKV